MLRLLFPVVLLLVSTAIMLSGQGLLTTFLPVRAEEAGFSNVALAAQGTGYFLGFVGGCFTAPWLVQRVGHIRAFAVLAALASALPLGHAIALDPAAWVIMRALTGACFAGLFTVIESWLNERATNQTRGQVLGAYTIINLVGLAGGQALLVAVPDAGVSFFMMASMLMSLAVVPVAMSTGAQPEPIAQVHLDVPGTYRSSPAAVVSVLGFGLIAGVFWTLAPVVIARGGGGLEQAALFSMVVILGGAAAQWPLGRLSDGVDRRLVLAGCFLALIGASLAVSSLLDMRGAAQMSPDLLIGAALFGAALMTLYPVSLAHLSDSVSREQFVGASGSLLMVYALGAAAGPALVAGAAALFGYGLTPFLSSAVLASAGALFVIGRIRSAAPVKPEEKDDFTLVTRTSPEALVLDPRGDGAPEDSVAAEEPAQADLSSETADRAP